MTSEKELVSVRPGTDGLDLPQNLPNFLHVVKEADELSKIHSVLNDKSLTAKRVLNALKKISEEEEEAEMVKGSTADLIDQQLSQIGVVNTDIDGNECLGSEYTSKEFLLDRIKGCEGFLGDIVKISKGVFDTIYMKTKDIYTLAMEDNNSLNNSLNVLEAKLKDPNLIFDDETKIFLSAYNVRKLSINGVVPKDLFNEIRKTVLTLKLLSNAYFKYETQTANDIISLFGNLKNINEENVLNRVKILGDVLNRNKFKECMYTLKDNEIPKDNIILSNTKNHYVFRRSVLLLGDHALINRVGDFNFNHFTDLTSLHEYFRSIPLDRLVEFKQVNTNKKDEEIYESKYGINPLKEQQVKEFIRMAKDCLDINKDIFNKNTILISLPTYQEILSDIANSDLEDASKLILDNIFKETVNLITRQNLKLKTNICKYLILLLTLVMQISDSSIIKGN